MRLERITFTSFLKKRDSPFFDNKKLIDADRNFQTSQLAFRAIVFFASSTIEFQEPDLQLDLIENQRFLNQHVRAGTKSGSSLLVSLNVHRT